MNNLVKEVIYFVLSAVKFLKVLTIDILKYYMYVCTRGNNRLINV